LAKTVRVDEETFRRLCEEAGRLEAVLKRPVSLDEAIRHMAGSLKASNRISDLAGSWEVSGDELKALREGLERGWSRWASRPSA
jgi:hypothetical protein